MPEPAEASSEAPPRSIAETLTEVAADASSLMRAEMTLAGIETRDNASALGGAVARIALGAVFIALAITFLTVAGVVALASLLGLLWALLIIAGTVAVLGFILIAAGQSAARKQRLLPVQAIARIASDIDSLQARAESIRRKGSHTDG